MAEQVLAVQRMQDYIEKHKTEEISLSDLARASLFSPWYAFRLFRNVLGLTPAEYIRKYRLTQAAKQLRGGEVKVIDAAMDSYDPSVIGYRWDDENPRIQLEPRGGRGYIELRAVRRVQK